MYERPFLWASCFAMTAHLLIASLPTPVARFVYMTRPVWESATMKAGPPGFAPITVMSRGLRR